MPSFVKPLAKSLTATLIVFLVAEATLRDLRAAQANLIQAEKMASLGQLTAGMKQRSGSVTHIGGL